MKQGWEIKKLGEVCEFRNGAAHEQYIDEDGQYILINSKFISADGEKIKKTNRALSPLFINDIAFVMSDVPKGKALAKCFLVDKADTYTLNQRIGAIKSNIFVPEFLVYQFNRNKYLLSFDNGENQTNLRKGDILNCPLWVPSKEEQQRIVAILDEAFAAITKAKANAEQNLKNAKELFESYLQSVFEKKGDGWVEKKLGEVYDVRDGTHDSPKYQSEGYPLVTSKNLKNHKLVLDDIKFISEIDYNNINKRSKVDVGDVLFAMIGTIGNPVVIEDEPNFAIKNVALFKVGSEQDSFFLKYFLDSKQTIEKMIIDAKGTTQKFVGLGYLRNFLILLPSLKEQQTIVRQLDVLRAETQKLEAVYQKKIADMEELKKSILQKAFAGKLKTEKEITV
ncbi:restriction endonuclease subunit S [Kamptonema cortianum]|nr:restriction endonuclease subunit S [Oscillatoria laete-virens]MDK3159503.1 restriction endonuclease subunit S [Kamptonema cortianum]MDL5053043.1 restriction endonuclease subunit S [Oscillatoria laete-virens NRMC-F 0139]